jgi:single-stranded-DNA-specific exonuclease
MRQRGENMLASRTRWKQTTYSTEEVEQWKNQLGVSSLVAKLFISRGWTDLQEAKEMLNIEKTDFHDPFLLDGMKEAVGRIEEAILNQERIRVYGDYDCDGVSSTTIMIHLLRELGASFDYYIPDRFKEGYGLNNGALDKAKQDGVKLIITVDTGISAREQIAYGSSIGLEFIITDHHEPPPLLPECIAIINPKKPSCAYPFKHLCGAGVAFKLSQALLKRIPYEWLDIAAIGTIADLVPLVGENRLIAFHGIRSINHTRHIGLSALIEVAGLADQVIDEQRIGFSIGPRINASGRLESASKAVELLISNNRDEALILAEEVDELNKQRRKMVDQITIEAIQWVEKRYPEVKPKALVVAKENWNVGVIGIVASRLVEKYYVPTIVLSIDPETGKAKGSARSIEGFNMYQALCECQEWLPHFGGHPMAAGMTLASDHVDFLRKRLAQLAEQWLQEEDFIPISSVDIECSLDEIRLETIEELGQLAPFGVGHSKPIILLKELSSVDLKPVGADKQHLKCQFKKEGILLDGIGFGLGEIASKISPEAKIDIIGQLAVNEWNGMKKPQMLIDDIRVPHRQYFDWRGVKYIERKWDQITFDHSVGVCHFREDMLSSKVFFPEDYLHFYLEEDGKIVDAKSDKDREALPSDPKVDTFILYDLPRSMEQLKEAGRLLGTGRRIYLLFQHTDSQFFSTIPSREQFKWFYGFLQKKERFDLKENGKKLAVYKGWTVDSIHFMSKVFLDLEFARIENGLIQLIPGSIKKELSTSQTYKQKQKEIQLEQDLLYSSNSELVHLLEELLQQSMIEERPKEANVHGF